MLLKFKEFLTNTWDANEFCHVLALQVQTDRELLHEMAMAGGEAPKMPVLYDKDDWDFLAQFPPEIWNQALSWRYNDGLREMMHHQQSPEDIPEGWDYVNKIVFDAPTNAKNATRKKWVFGSPDGKPTIYAGLTQLAHKLTSPPKKNPHATGEGKAHWRGDGPSLAEIDPNQTDPNHPKHPKNYKHGLYDFDLSGMVEVDPDYIDQMPDTEVYEKIKEKYHGLDINHPEVQKAIRKKREAMKKELKHTFSGFDVLQKGKAGESISNWLKANATQERLFGEHPTVVKDPVTGEEKPVTQKTPYEVKNDINHHWDLKTASTNLHYNIPVIKRNISYTELDPAKGTITPVNNKPFYIPVLNPVKTIPSLSRAPHDLQLTTEQKAQIARNRGKNVGSQASGEYETKFAATMQDTQGLLDNWDVLTDEQKAWIKNNTKNLHNVAQTYHSGSELDPVTGERLYDPHANPKNKSFYAVGFHPNYKTQERPSFSLPKDKVDLFIKKYRDQIFAEVMGTSEKGAIGDKSDSPIDRMISRLKASGKYPDQVIESLENRVPEMAEYITYMILTWLDHPEYGIKDPTLGLLKDIPEGEYDEEANRKNRKKIIFNFLTSFSQRGTSDVLARRRRERYGQTLKTSLNQTQPGSDLSGAATATADMKPTAQKIDTSAVRSWLHSDMGSIPTAAHKTSPMFERLAQFFSTKRSYILSILNSPQVSADLKDAEAKTMQAMQIAQDLYQQYSNEYKQQHPSWSDEKHEEMVTKKLQDNLPAALKEKHPTVFQGAHTSPEIEDIMAKVKNFSKGQTGLTGEQLNKAETSLGGFLNELITKKQARLVKFNAQSDEFEEAHDVFNLADFKPNAAMIVHFIKAIYPEQFTSLMPKAVADYGPKLYNAVLKEHDVDKPFDLVKKEIEIAAKQLGIELPSVAATPQQPQKLAPQQPQKPLSVAAKPIGELLNKVSSFNSASEAAELVKNIVTNKTELMADKIQSGKILSTIGMMRKRWSEIMMNIPVEQRPGEFMKFKSALFELEKLASELHGA